MNTKCNVLDAREYEPSPVLPRRKRRDHTPFRRCRNPFVEAPQGVHGSRSRCELATPVSLQDNRLDSNDNPDVWREGHVARSVVLRGFLRATES
jgi:hypothetical protein